VNALGEKQSTKVNFWQQVKIKRQNRTSTEVASLRNLVKENYIIL
jgi:hypothetical protein